MPSGSQDSSLTRVQPFFEALLTRDAAGRTWLPALLAAAPNARAALGGLVDAPGTVLLDLTVRGIDGRRVCFEYPVAASRRLLAWYIDHPDQLTWPADATMSAQTARLRRALLYDEPTGARAKAQERARELLAASRSLFARDWWRFEGTTPLHCVLMTDRLVVTIEGKGSEPLAPATTWYPSRSELVRSLEAAKALADGRRWGSLLISEQPLDVSLGAGAPHLTEPERDELRSAYLGNLSWDAACHAVGMPLDSLPGMAPT